MKFKSLVRALILIVLGLSLWVGYQYKQETPRPERDTRSLQAEALYITPQGNVSDAIVKLMGLTGIRVENDPVKVENDWPEAKMTIKSRSLEEVVGAVQGKIDPSITWIGDRTKERWEKDPTKPTLSATQARDIIQTCIKDLRQGEKTGPSRQVYNAVLFLGSTLSSVRSRLAYLNSLYTNGDHYSTFKLHYIIPVYILTGERALDPKVGETPENLMDPHNGIIEFREDWVPTKDIVADEGAMVQLVFDQSRHKSLPPESIHLVHAPKANERTGTLQRATLESTVVQWLKEYSPKGGNYIAISNQPYNFYQECLIRKTLLEAGRSDIHVEVIGSEMKDASGNNEAAIKQATNLLDNVSRILFRHLQIKKLEKSS